MKTTLILTGLVALVAAQGGAKGSGAKGSAGKGMGGAPKSSGGGAPKGSGGGGFAGIQTMISCVSKCASDNLGIDIAAVKGGTMPTNIPCMDKMSPKGDLLPAITCICSEPKFDALVKCQAGCGSLASGLTTQKDNLCKDPKAAVDQIGSLMAKFGGGAAGAMGTKGPGGATRRFRV